MTDNRAAISGPDMLPALELTNCNPTIGEAYSVTHIDGVEEVDNSTGEIFSFLGGITPIFTVFIPSLSNNVTGSILRAPETCLSCLKYMATGTANDPGLVVGAASNQSPAGFATGLGWALAMFLWFSDIV
jgi:hypothetical protein